MDCGYPLEPPRRGCSNEYAQSMFWAEVWKVSEFLCENFQFLEVKFSIYLNRHVFVMFQYPPDGHFNPSEYCFIIVACFNNVLNIFLFLITEDF